jgi:DNA primase
MTWVNYKEIKTRVRMEQVLEHYGVLGELREKGDTLVGRCPIHKGSNANQFHVSRTKNNFLTFVCDDFSLYPRGLPAHTL